MSKKDQMSIVEGASFGSVGEMEEYMSNRKIGFWENIQIEVWYIWERITDVPRNIKYFIQRGIRGWSDRDLWCMHAYLTDVVLTMLVEYKAYNTGDDAKFNKALDGIIDGFTILKKCDIGEEIEWGGYYPPDAKKDISKIIAKYGNRLTTKEEEEQVKHAFKLLADYYHYLWN